MSTSTFILKLHCYVLKSRLGNLKVPSYIAGAADHIHLGIGKRTFPKCIKKPPAKILCRANVAFSRNGRCLSVSEAHTLIIFTQHGTLYSNSPMNN